jgi:beta-ureidopropionase / N-carbamoyl-L-amino-acid hydrolase
VAGEGLVIVAADLAARLAGLDGIGEREDGVTRLAWTPEDAACRAWFGAQAKALGLRVETDPAGNLWALPAGEGPWWGVGSHLDSVRSGGRFDGPLGVAAAFEVAARSPARVAVVGLADEEGARFNTPTFGSRALVGRLDVDEVLARRDDDGIALRDAMAAAGVDPDRLGDAPRWLGMLRGFLELHIDQTRDLQAAGRAAGVVAALASRLRVQADLHGRADHAGTTRRDERRDAMSAAARLVVAAEDLADGKPDFVVTAARILVEPNALTTIPAHVRLWIDARAPTPGEIDAWRASLDAAAGAIAERTGVGIELKTASRSTGIAFDERVRTALRRALGDRDDELVCFAGHDAGVLAEKLPAGMVFVRNPSGVSHSPAEEVALEDAAVAATALLLAVEELAR